ncbi:MAG: type IX secretion system membrane protein PorP/SprF [Bacteroidetes bacterium]|nr:MAG: type IX secretion system membrane protein PorP/SprF [Bacteroidota bacterium]
MNRTSARILFFALLTSVFAYGQDPHFSQFYANSLYLNPAFAGVDRCPKLSLNYRNQYPTLGVYETFSGSYDQYVNGLNGGLGVLVMRDEAAQGALTLTEASVVYSYHLSLSRKFQLLAGFQATFRQRGLDFNALTFPDQIDQFYGFVRPTNELPPDQPTTSHVDISVGLIGYGKGYYFGAAVHHLTEPNEAFYTDSKLPRKYTLHGGASIPVGHKRLHNSTQSYLIPNLVIQQQGNIGQVTLGVSFNRSFITGGLAYRNSNTNPDAIVAIIGFTPPDWPFKFGYSYDFTVSDFGGASNGAHEISLSYRFDCRRRPSRAEALKCPTF